VLPTKQEFDWFYLHSISFY